MLTHHDDTVRQPALVLPFHLRGSAGRVAVFYEANTDPARWGFPLLALPFDVMFAAGFPVCQAVIEYAGEGYHAVMGWLQVVCVTDHAGHTDVSVDIAPVHAQSDTPFIAYGSLPTLFDAPGPNPPRSDETWLAESFLAIMPDVARSRRVQALLGFRWGYELTAMRPTLLPLQVASEDEWQRCASILRERYPGWDFAPRFTVG